ncbi:poly(ADP-ribose) polymerase family member 14-related sequence 1 isoform X2 [Hypomesus transpacificus]|uniref:poly(ADP-ribose) polymerase family member 14-related sequence 1 isoform X2 n=1 Tax=Hypomesus transpacificus TaxID=137520 RepID=UPI001F0758FA|nr:poly(ADP-ribose) polymerase family member 14-related sequence 1 isoform X2 [Hypomesus transpacificus]
MADAYLFPLLVELESNQNVLKLKNKLVKYFQSKKANGDDCQVECGADKSTVVRFKTEDARQKVVSKQVHEIILDQERIKLTVRLPKEVSSANEASADPLADNTFVANQLSYKVPEEEEKEDEEKEEQGSTSSVLGNVKENQEFLEMLVENILSSLGSGSDSPSASETFSLEILPDTAMAVVTFQSVQESNNFVSNCIANRVFKKNKLTVRPLEVTTKAILEDVPPNVSSDHLLLYFEKEGEDVQDVSVNEEEQTAIINFQDPRAVGRIIKRKHQIHNQPVMGFPFYESLGMALYGKNRPSLKLPPAHSENIDQDVWKYLCDTREAADSIHHDLAQHFCKVDLQQPTVKLSPLPELLKQKGIKAKDLQEWKGTVQTAFLQALAKYKLLKLLVQAAAWEEAEREIKHTVSGAEVVVVPDKAQGVITVVGLVEEVNRLKPTLNEILDNIDKRIQREKSSIKQDVNLCPSIYQILLKDGLNDKLAIEYPELKMTYDGNKGFVTFYGLQQEVLDGKKKVLDRVVALKRKTLEWDDYMVEFLQGEDQEKLTDSLLISKGIHAALEIDNRLQLLALSEESLSEAEDHLNRLLLSEYIDIEDCNVLEMSEWQDLVSRMEHTSNMSFRKVRIQTTGDDQRVVVSGYKDSVLSVRNDLNDFMHQNAEVEETLEVKREAIIKFIQNHHRNAWSDLASDKVNVTFRKEKVVLNGARVHVTSCKSGFEDLISSTCFSVLTVSKPGAKKLFQDEGAMYVSTVMGQTGCLVQLVEGSHDTGQDSALGGASKPIYQVTTSDGVEIAVSKADVCSYAVHAVVNAANVDLQHSGGLAGALLDAAGPRLQDECDQIINRKGKLKPGDCVLTGAGGRLRCKSIIHAVGPRYDHANPQKAEGQLRRAVKGSLDLAETNNCLSVALPAISSGNLGFPLSLCTQTIARAIKDYCDDKFGENTLKKIHLVDNDDRTVEAMEAAVRKEFGDHGTSHAQLSPLTSATPTQHVPMVLSTKNSDRVKTREGLSIVLMRGNIQDASTEALVNTVGEDLVLNSGAVSKAILSVAGPELQALVDQQAVRGNCGDIIVTSGGNLKCKVVFHTIAPNWDNGGAVAQKMLSRIVKECLDKAEHQRLSSITFPAVGTGNLGFPKDLVASLMLNKVLKFSSKKNPKHLKEVVFVLHPSDPQTIQAFNDEFTKKFTTQSAFSGATTAAATATPKGFFSKVTSSSGVHETTMSGVVIQVVTGDITKETTDVIVNSSNQDFSLKSGVSKAILDAAGQTVEAECQLLGAQPNAGMIMTQPGNLQAKKIIHLIGQTAPQKIFKAVKEALLMCAVNNYTSISIPALGTGRGQVQAGQVADAMLDAVVDVINQKSHNNLTLVRIVVFQTAMVKDFLSSMQNKEGTEDIAEEKDTVWGKIKSFFGLTGTQKPQKDKDFVIEGKQADPACFHICGDSLTRVDHAKQLISDLITNQQFSNSIKDNAILSLSDPDRQRIRDMEATMDVSVTLEYASSQAVITVEGMSKDVSKTTNEIHEMLRRAREQEAFNKNVEMIGSMTEWQHQQQGGPFVNFDPVSNFHLEDGFQKKRAYVEVNLQGQIYKVLLPDGPGTDAQGNTLQIRRIDKLAGQKDNLPPHWDAMPANTSCLSCPIQPGSTEYNTVQGLFKATCPRNIIKIERIQNSTLWKSLQIKKQGMEKRNGHQNNEKQLFHGACYQSIDHITHNGFNRSYAGKNAAAYGNGTYFAVEARYSASDTYSRPDPQGQKFMFLCCVLTGDFTRGQHGMIVPPSKGNTNAQLYDSVTDNPARPSMFVIFHDCQAYPEYLITFN